MIIIIIILIIVIITLRTTCDLGVCWVGNRIPLSPGEAHYGSGGLLRGLGGPALQFAIDSVGVLAAAAWPVDAIVAVLAGLDAAAGGWVAEQAGEERGH